MAAGVTTVSAVTASIRYRADQVNSSFVTDAEILTYIQSSQQELYDLLVTTYGEDYYSSIASTITTDGSNDRFALPTDFYKLLGCSLLIQSGTPNQYITMRPFAFAERDKWSTGAVASGRQTPLRYRLEAGNLWLRPFPASGQVIQLYYVPRLSVPTLPTDTIDGVNGWEEYLVVDGAIKCMQKEESDCRVLMAQKDALVRRINAAAANRDAGEPTTVADTRRDYDDGSVWPSGWNP